MRVKQLMLQYVNFPSKIIWSYLKMIIICIHLNIIIYLSFLNSFFICIYPLRLLGRSDFYSEGGNRKRYPPCLSCRWKVRLKCEAKGDGWKRTDRVRNDCGTQPELIVTTSSCCAEDPPRDPTIGSACALTVAACASPSVTHSSFCRLPSRGIIARF